jgi:uncharacterized membrane protein required for colicin V production
MTLLDWALVVVWLGVTLGGFWEGAVRLVFGGGGLIVGVWLAVAAGADVAAALFPVVSVDWIAAVLGRLLPLISCVLVALGAGWGIERTLKAFHMRWLNRLAGAMLAGVLAAALLGLFLVTAMRLSPSWNQWCAASVVAPRLVWLWGWTVENQPVAAEAVSSVEESITR